MPDDLIDPQSALDSIFSLTAAPDAATAAPTATMPPPPEMDLSGFDMDAVLQDFAQSTQEVAKYKQQAAKQQYMDVLKGGMVKMANGKMRPADESSMWSAAGSFIDSNPDWKKYSQDMQQMKSMPFTPFMPGVLGHEKPLKAIGDERPMPKAAKMDMWDKEVAEATRKINAGGGEPGDYVIVSQHLRTLDERGKEGFWKQLCRGLIGTVDFMTALALSGAGTPGIFGKVGGAPQLAGKTIPDLVNYAGQSARFVGQQLGTPMQLAGLEQVYTGRQLPTGMAGTKLTGQEEAGWDTSPRRPVKSSTRTIPKSWVKHS